MGSFSTLPERINTVMRFGIVYLLIVFLFFMNVIAVSYPFAGDVKAPYFLMAVYYWAVYRPTIVPSWLVFICGLLMDFLSGFPPGLNALVYVLVRGVVTDQRRFLTAQSFFMVWFGFALVCIAAFILQWAVFGLTQMAWTPLKPLWIPVSLGILFFPLVCIFLNLTHKILPPPIKSIGFNS